MAETKYGVIKKSKPQFPVRELLVIPHRKRDLTLSFPAFGPNNYRSNTKNMRESYSHPVTGQIITFTPATTSKSISAVAYDFENMAKPQILDPKWLQTGYIIKTQEGIFTNTTETNESRLKQLLNNTQKVNGIYLLDKEVAFAPYDSFERGVQDVDTFSYGGLARALEHTSNKIAKNLKKIASPRFYKEGVNIWGFDSVNKPVQMVAGLVSYWGVDGNRLDVVGFDWDDLGCAFGVLNESRSI